MERLNEIIKTNGAAWGLSYREDPKAYTEWQAEAYNNTVGDLDKEDGYSCNFCKNKGYIKFAKEDNGKWYEFMKRCGCQSVHAMLRKLENSGLHNIGQCTFDGYKAEEKWQAGIKAIAEEYASELRKEWFFIGGQSGAGKTHICTAIALKLIKTHNKSVYYMMWRDDAAKLKALVNDAQEYARRIEELKTIDVLYIDDLFKTGNGDAPTKGDINLAFEVLNHRYVSGKTTIISTEYTLSEILSFTEAIGGRIAERARGRYLISIGKDRAKNYRLKGAVEL